jgi:hypothetical protein
MLFRNYLCHNCHLGYCTFASMVKSEQITNPTFCFLGTF